MALQVQNKDILPDMNIVIITLLTTFLVAVVATLLEERFGRDDARDYRDWGGFDYWN